MIPVKVRNTIIGEGIPKICVPIVGKTVADIQAAAEEIKALQVDIVEWRADWFDDVFDEKAVGNALAKLRAVLGELPLLFTFRTAMEGGEKAITPEAYEHLNRLAVASGCVDVLDVEAFFEEEVVRRLIAYAHEKGVKVIASNHDFQKTPAKEELIRRLCWMQELGADIPKIAVMPVSRQDVLTLLVATEEMNRRHATGPIITMSMAGMGMISRVCGEVFGSAITFGAAGKTSAPGQLEVETLRETLITLHEGGYNEYD